MTKPRVHKNHLKFAGLVLSCLVLFFSQSPLSYGVTQDTLDSIRNNTPFYDPNSEVTCDAGGVGAVSGTLPSTVPNVYVTLFSNAAKAAGTNPQFIAAIFVTEHGNTWPSPAGPWASSSVGASGPFQFMPGTWQAYKTDGDGDGVADVQNLTDAAYSAGKLLAANGAKADTPLGDIAHPWAKGTFMYAAGAYNAGGGTLEEDTKPTDPLEAPGLQGVSNITLTGGKVMPQVENYVANVYYLISSGFVHGNPGYGNADGKVADHTGGATTIPTSGNGVSTGACNGAGAVTGNAVQTAINLAWDDYPKHDFNSKDPKPAYLEAKNKVEGVGDNVPDEAALTDCGVFIATVMISSGADPNWPKLTTGVMLQYAIDHPDKYTVIPSFNSAADLRVGDILVNGSHIYMYVGKQSDGKSVAEASHFDHVPEIDADPYPSQSDGGAFSVVRMK